MLQPRIVRPHFPQGYVENPRTLLPWSHVEQRLTEARNYWLCSVRPSGRPHVIPKWAVWVNDHLYFDGSAQTRHAKNIATNPQVSMHLESGDDVIIMEGEVQAVAKPAPKLAQQIAAAYARKYADMGYAPSPEQWDDGGLFEITPHQVLAWTNFMDDPTKFILT